METTITMIDARDIMPGNNDRTVFDGARLAELASSIRANGLIQPVTVRPIGREGAFGEVYQIVAGERRYRACGIAGLDAVPCIIRDLDDEAASAVMLLENTSRADLDAVDEGLAYMARMRSFGWTVDEIATRAGVSPVRVRFRLKLLGLRDDLQAMVRSGQLPLGYAQTLADGELGRDRQLIAVSRLRDNPTPTPAWFRRVVGELQAEQAQESLFDMVPCVTAAAESAEPAALPPTPATHAPDGASLDDHIAYWQAAAIAWDRLGKSFKRQECHAAVRALESARALFGQGVQA